MNEFAVILLLAVIILAICIYFVKYGFDLNDVDIFKHNIYLDNNGTTMMCFEALKAYNIGTKYGNTSSSYAVQAKELVAKNDQLIKGWIRSDANIIYTSGASESNNTILKSLTDFYQFSSGQVRPHIIMSSYEHQSHLNCAQTLEKEGRIRLTLIKPSVYGLVDPVDVASAVSPETILVSIIHINNELGTINNIRDICAAVKFQNPNVYFHSDIVQSFGKYSIPMNEWRIDALSVSYHKIYGPQGIGLLIVNNSLLSKIQMYPLIAGSQNYGARGGTINIAGISGGHAALLNVIDQREKKNNRLFEMKRYLVEYFAKTYSVGDYRNYAGKPDDFTRFGSGSSKNEIVFLGNNPLGSDMSPNTLLIAVVKYGPIQGHFCNIRLKQDLQDRHVVVSIGSACHSASPEPSHVLHAIGAPYVIRCGVIRISLGDYNTISEIKKFCHILSECINLQNC
jgi:cysteine desulfurase